MKQNKADKSTFKLGVFESSSPFGDVHPDQFSIANDAHDIIRQRLDVKKTSALWLPASLAITLRMERKTNSDLIVYFGSIVTREELDHMCLSSKKAKEAKGWLDIFGTKLGVQMRNGEIDPLTEEAMVINKKGQCTFLNGKRIEPTPI